MLPGALGVLGLGLGLGFGAKGLQGLAFRGFGV